MYAKQDVSILLFIDSSVAYVNDIEMQIDEDNPDVVPFIKDNRTMIPLRFIAENIGLYVNWIDSDKTVLLTNSKLEIKLTLDSDIAIVDGTEITLDVSPILVNDRLFLPVRFISENFFCSVDWDNYNERVIIKGENEIDINEPEVQELFTDIMNGDSFISYHDAYYETYIDAEIFDTTNFSWMGGRIRELITILSIRDIPNNEYTDSEAADIITEFLSKGENIDEMTEFDLGNLKTALENGANFGESADGSKMEERLVCVYKKGELDEISTKLFGIPLPKSESAALSIAYASFFLYNRTNTLERFPTTLAYTFYYNEASEEYLVTADLFMLSEWGMNDYQEYYNEHYESLKSSTELLRATRHNDEISLYVYHEGEFLEYSGGTDFYKGEYKNTYKKGDNGFYWICASGRDE